jgi:hypothetical protein
MEAMTALSAGRIGLMQIFFMALQFYYIFRDAEADYCKSTF